MSNFKLGEFYMHQNALDTCIEIAKIEEDAPLPTYRVRWWNLGYMGRPFMIEPPSRTYRVIIGPKEAAQWTLLSLEAMTNPRTLPGLPTEPEND